MMSAEQYREVQREAGKRAREEAQEPYVAEVDGDEGVRAMPNLGSYKPKGWRKVTEYFVDNSGFGAEGEAALTYRQFLKHVIEGYGYAITGVGQFQVYITKYKRTK